MTESPDREDADLVGWDVPDPRDAGERRRQQRREYHRRRTRQTAGGHEHGRPWTIADARVALDVARTVPEAAIELGRSASAVESLRQRWRAGRLPAGLADQMPRPPAARAGGDTDRGASAPSAKQRTTDRMGGQG